MDTATATLVTTQGLPLDEYRRDQFRRQICDVMGIDFDALMREVKDLCRQRDRYRDDCEALTRRCDTLEAIQKVTCCPGNQLYSNFTLDEYSGNNQVNLLKAMAGLGGDYVDTFPLPPGKMIRLTHDARPGYMPEKIAIDFSFANAGDNYLDLELQLYLIPGGQEPLGKPYGPRYRGNQFLNKDGTQIHINFPPYRDQRLTVGSLEKLAIEIRPTGAVNNLNSVFVTLYHDARRFYQLCKQSCDPTTCG